MLGLNSMAWLGLLVWVVVPLFAVLATTLLWRRARLGLKRALALVVGFAILSVPALVSNGVKAYYDRQVRELCVKDGGVRVYETVRLTEEEFDELKRRNFVLPLSTMAKSTDEYYHQPIYRYYREGILNMRRTQSQVIRRSDGKVLGESISYGRAGGDLPGPWHHSSFKCPDPVEHPSNLETAIFLKGDEQ